LNQQKAKLEAELADTGLYAEQRKNELQQLLRDKAATDQQLEEAESAWMEAAEALEQAKA